MPFHVRLASHDEPRVKVAASARAEQQPTGVREFFNGMSFGFGLLMIFAGAYLVVSTRIAAIPDLKALIGYWFSMR